MKKPFSSIALGFVIGGSVLALLGITFTIGGTEWTERTFQTGVNFFICWFMAIVTGVGAGAVHYGDGR